MRSCVDQDLLNKTLSVMAFRGGTTHGYVCFMYSKRCMLKKKSGGYKYLLASLMLNKPFTIG